MRLFIVYDRRIAHEPPTWLMTNFPSSHSGVTAVADQTGNFDIYSGAAIAKRNSGQPWQKNKSS